MNKNFILTKPVEIQGYHVIGQIAKSRERKELDPVLLRAQETCGTNAQDVATHLLFEPSREIVAQRLLTIGESLGLLKKISYPSKNFALTEQGKKAIETGKIFVPEHGAWTLWTSLDPLLPSPILRVDFFEETKARSENYSNLDNSRSPDTGLNFLRNAIDQDITPPASSDGITIRILELEDKVHKAVKPNAELSLLWNIGDRNLRLKGTWENKEVDTELQPPNVSFDEIWDDLLANEGLSKRWIHQHHALQVSFNEINDIERETMKRDIEFRTPSLPNYGRFESFKVEKIPLTARFRADAQEWSDWRLHSRIKEFATSNLYSEWWKEASEPFNEFSLECPTRSKLADKLWSGSSERPDTRTWNLIAVEDWNLK